MHRRPFFLAVLSLAVPAHAGTSEVCPWITQGSAAALLKGDVVATVSVAGEREGSCSFSRKESAVVSTLLVLVRKEAGQACTQEASKLSGIGNEALLCKVHRSRSETVERIVSRVRDTYFSVTLTVAGAETAARADEVQREILTQAAEQVAGNLF